jgi:hypothetical protein
MTKTVSAASGAAIDREKMNTAAPPHAIENTHS